MGFGGDVISAKVYSAKKSFKIYYKKEVKNLLMINCKFSALTKN